MSLPAHLFPLYRVCGTFSRISADLPTCRFLLHKAAWQTGINATLSIRSIPAPSRLQTAFSLVNDLSRTFSSSTYAAWICHRHCPLKHFFLLKLLIKFCNTSLISVGYPLISGNLLMVIWAFSYNHWHIRENLIKNFTAINCS
jgi:hypothetical protein